MAERDIYVEGVGKPEFDLAVNDLQGQIDAIGTPDLTPVYDAISVVQNDVNAHEARTDNPHAVTKAQVGLQFADNTSDANKPISTATQTALDLKVDKISGKGLSTEDYTTTEKTKLSGIASGATANSSDATLLARANHTGTQAISTVSGLQTALDAKEAAANKDASGGYAGLTGYKLDLKNNAGTFTSLLQNTNTAIRNYTLPDRSITIAGVDDVYFILLLNNGVLSPNDATTYYFGLTLLPATNVAANHQFQIGYNVVVIGAIVSASLNTVQGSAEDSTMKINNLTTGVASTIGTFKTNAAPSQSAVSTTITGISIPIAATDNICGQWNTPNWVSNPATVRPALYLILKRA